LGNFGNRPQTSQVMVLVHRGRKSGQRRMTPVNYALIDDDVYCVAAFGAAADWVRNLAADPNVEVWLRDGWWAGVAEELPSNDPRRLHLMRQVLIASGFAAPLFAGINPKTISNPALDKLTTNYRLFCIVRTAARTGPGGPGEWAWVWPLTTSLLLVFLLWQRRSDAREG
jgi:deazaflavin-dependent oxidoreductase (nitroreductase family)